MDYSKHGLRKGQVKDWTLRKKNQNQTQQDYKKVKGKQEKKKENWMQRPPRKGKWWSLDEEIGPEQSWHG